MAIRRAEYLAGTHADWTSLNPILPRGQLAVEVPANAIKIGDGVTPYNALDFVTSGSGEFDEIDGGKP